MGSRQLTEMTPFKASPAKCRGERRPHGDLRMGRPAAALITLLTEEGREGEWRLGQKREKKRGWEGRGRKVRAGKRNERKGEQGKGEKRKGSD